MAIKMIDGKWMMDITRPDGTVDTIHMHGKEEKQRQEAYLKDKADFNSKYYWNPDSDYQSRYGGLFGGIDEGLNYTPSFGAGPNQNWRHALNGRLRMREGGDNSRLSHFEERTSTTAKDYRANMLNRNNAIEDMYRRGYSMDQINNHVTGKVNINSVDPDWKDYYKARNSAGTVDAAGLLSGETQEPIKFWGDKYFIGGPEQDKRNPFDMGSFAGNAPNPFAPQDPAQDDSTNYVGRGQPRNIVPADNPIAPPIPSSKPKGGFMGAYNARREELANKPSVMSLFDEMKEYPNE